MKSEHQGRSIAASAVQLVTHGDASLTRPIGPSLYNITEFRHGVTAPVEPFSIV